MVEIHNLDGKKKKLIAGGSVGWDILKDTLKTVDLNPLLP